MSRRGQWLIALLALLVLGAGGLYLARHLHSYEEVIDRGPSPQVRTHPWLAAEMFLRQRGLKVQAANGLEVLQQLPSKGQSLLLLGDRDTMTARQAEEVLAWVRAGGRLLFVAQALWDDDKAMSGDLLLDRLQLRQFMASDLPALPPVQPDHFPQLTKLYLENEQAPAYFSFNPDFHLEDPANKAQSWANSSNATHLMQLAYGEGLITVVTDADLWANVAIRRYDNAWLLWYLNQGTDVTLVLRSAHDSLATLLWRHYPQALLSLALLLILGVWHFALRQGPIQPAPALGRRQLREHLRATAAFVLRNAGQDRLLRALQQDILRRARRRHPGFERLAVAEQWQVLARLTRQSTAAIGQALRPPLKQRLGAAEFSRQVAHLQTLRNAL
ncbi:DUF4350 domain-containing protein [Pseudomonas sp.]|uniref:DUF4350 domain-containing protein n=1 Tax=Pseudomonas sp. TaxID=306 RepID=UPI003CC5B8CD